MILDLFAGPGGWDVGLRALGREDVVGIELDAAACATRDAAGFLTLRCDVEAMPTCLFHGAEGLIASPPCQDFSAAGKKAGRTGDKGRLIDVVPGWVKALRPEWVACEQVPEAVDIWREHADEYRLLGYSTWVGVLNAANFGVPQTRKRAILMASRVQGVVPPQPTHAKHPTPTMFGQQEPWVTMASALGWGATERPVPTIHAGKTGDGRVFGSANHGSNVALTSQQQTGAWIQRERSGDRSEEGFDATAIPSQTLTSKARSWHVWPYERPATCVMGDPRLAPPGYRGGHDDRSTTMMANAIKLTVAEAATLQSFPPDYPWQGSRTKQFQQIGNAIPVKLAESVLRCLIGSGDGKESVREEEDQGSHGVSASTGVGVEQRADTAEDDRASQERRQAGQSNRESGVDDAPGTQRASQRQVSADEGV